MPHFLVRPVQVGATGQATKFKYQITREIKYMKIEIQNVKYLIQICIYLIQAQNNAFTNVSRFLNLL